MKKLILSVMVVAFAVAVQAGESKSTEKAGCCPSKAEAKAQCGKDAKSCPADKAAKDAKQALNSPKAK
jgi:hypothetical protein